MTKSIDDYAASILQYHVELQGLPPQHPDYEKIDNQLSRQLTAWGKKLKITVQVANNETTPWLENELGYTCIPMSLKKESQMRQTGDYVAYLDDYNHFCGLCVERKTLDDLHGTLMNKDRRGRLYREIARYEADSRFNRFMLIAECSYEEFLTYIPAIYVFQWEAIPGPGTKKLIEYLKWYYKIDNITSKQIFKTDTKIFISCEKTIVIELLKNGTASLMIDGVMVDTLYIEKKYGKNNLYQKKGASEASKIETMNSLENRIQVSFIGSRKRAVEKYGGLVRQWCRLNYKEVLNIGL